MGAQEQETGMTEYRPIESGITFRVKESVAKKVCSWLEKHEYDPACPFCRIAEGQRIDAGLEPREVKP